MAKRRKQVVHFLNTYRFQAGEKDPIIDQVHTLFQDIGASVSEIHEISGVSTSTLYNWFDGPTRRPQHATVAAVLAALGYEFKLSAHGRSVRDGVRWEAAAPAILKRVASLRKPKARATTAVVVSEQPQP